MTENTKKGPGQPSKLTEQIKEVLENLAGLGYTNLEMATICSVSEQTFYNWQKYDPVFFESLKGAKDRADSAVEQSLWKSALGLHEVTEIHEGVDASGNIVDKKIIKQVPPNATAQLFWLKNRQPEKFRDKKEITGNIKVTTVEDLIDEAE